MWTLVWRISSSSLITDLSAPKRKHWWLAFLRCFSDEINLLIPLDRTSLFMGFGFGFCTIHKIFPMRWDGWLASRTQWTWVWANSRRWWGTGKPDVLRLMGSQRVGHDWVTEWQSALRPFCTFTNSSKCSWLMFWEAFQDEAWDHFRTGGQGGERLSQTNRSAPLAGARVWL